MSLHEIQVQQNLVIANQTKNLDTNVYAVKLDIFVMKHVCENFDERKKYCSVHSSYWNKIQHKAKIRWNVQKKS